MIVVRVELYGATTGTYRELARMAICNDGTGDLRRRNYDVFSCRGRSTKDLNRFTPQRKGRVKNWPSEQLHVWNLVAHALKRMGYGKPKKKKSPAKR